MATLGGDLAEIEGVAEAYSVTGQWDFVVIVRVARPRADRRGHRRPASASCPGVARTQTMVAFAAYSRHDLEAMFSIGQ